MKGWKGIIYLPAYVDILNLSKTLFERIHYLPKTMLIRIAG